MHGDLIPIVLFIMLGLVGFSFFFFAFKGKQALHQTLQMAFEKGQSMSPESIEKILQGQKHPQADFKRGVLLVSLAAAIGLYGLIDPFGVDMVGFSLFPLAIGIGYLVVWKFAPKDA